MPLPTSISDLSQTAASNSPSGSETPNLIDDYFQVYAAYIAQLRDGPGFVSGVKSNVLGTVSLPAYSFVGDTDTGMFAPAANTLAWSVGGTEVMRLDSGNLIVGNGSPTSRANIFQTRTNGANALALSLHDSATGNQTPGFGQRINWYSNGIGTNAAIGFEVGGDGTNNQSQIAFYTQAIAGGLTLRAVFDSSGNLIQRPPTTPPTLTTNGELVITPTSNTNVRISYRGSDGVTRVANLTLA